MAKAADDRLNPNIRTLPVAVRRRLRGPLAEVRKHVKLIAASRNRLRTLVGEIESIVESADRGVEELESGVAALSEYL